MDKKDWAQIRGQKSLVPSKIYELLEGKYRRVWTDICLYRTNIGGQKTLYGPIWGCVMNGLIMGSWRQNKGGQKKPVWTNMGAISSKVPPSFHLWRPYYIRVTISRCYPLLRHMFQLNVLLDPLLMGSGFDEMALLGGWRRRKEV